MSNSLLGTPDPLADLAQSLQPAIGVPPIANAATPTQDPVQPAPQPGGRLRSLLSNFFQGAGAAMMQHVGLPTPQEQAQQAFNNDLAQRRQKSVEDYHDILGENAGLKIDLQREKQLGPLITPEFVATNPWAARFLGQHMNEAFTGLAKTQMQTEASQANAQLGTITRAATADAGQAETARHNRAIEGISLLNAKMSAGKKDVSEQAIETAAQSLAQGDLTRLKDISSMRGDQRLLIFNRAKQINPQFSTGEIDRKVKMEDSFTNGKDGQNLQSFGTFLEHAGEASQITNEYRTTNVKLLNTPLNKIRSAFGDAAYTRYATALEPVRKEFEGFLLGGRALYGDDRKAAETILSDDATMAQQQAALKQMGHTVKARFNEANFRYKRTMGKELEGAVSPEAISGAKQIGVDLGTGGGAQDQPEQTATGPNGHKIVVRGGRWVDAASGQPIQ